MRRSSKLQNGSRPQARAIITFLVVLVSFVFHSVFISHVIHKLSARQAALTAYSNYEAAQAQRQPLQALSTLQLPAAANTSYPDVFIYRRTKKTGSTSMLDALVRVMKDKDYVPLYYDIERMNIIVRTEFLKPKPRRLLILQHNKVNRQHTIGRTAVIADTVYDGFRQMTAFCRFVRNIKDCGPAMVACLEAASSKAQVRYRWCGSTVETPDTYIDLPLSSAHPALSTTVLRTVFPDALLDIPKLNAAGSACEETPQLRAVYDQNYVILEKQIALLRKRLLSVAGYPTSATSLPGTSTEEMMDAAELIESKKYNFGTYSYTKDVGTINTDLKEAVSDWVRSPSGKLEPKHRVKS